MLSSNKSGTSHISLIPMSTFVVFIMIWCMTSRQKVMPANNMRFCGRTCWCKHCWCWLLGFMLTIPGNTIEPVLWCHSIYCIPSGVHATNKWVAFGNVNTVVKTQSLDWALNSIFRKSFPFKKWTLYHNIMLQQGLEKPFEAK